MSDCNSKEYRLGHRYCPVCGCVSFEQTTLGFLGSKDMNRATCGSCGWIGVVHDRVGARKDDACQCQFCQRGPMESDRW